MQKAENFSPQVTGDGSFTFFSEEFNEAFHSHFGAKQESFCKYVIPTQLPNFATKPVVRLLDICYGLGYNTAAALETIWSINPDCYIQLIGLELNPSVPQAAIRHNLFDSWNSQYTEILHQLAFTQQVTTNHLQAQLFIGDARKAIARVHQLGFLADAIFLDPFSPPQCPQLWTVEFMKQVALCLHRDGFLATYSCAAAVRTALLAAGLAIGSTPPVGRRSPGTVASYPHIVGLQNSSLLPPLSLEEQEHLLTRAAIPYRDPKLQDPTDVILQRRQAEQKLSSLEPTSHWRKRWCDRNHT